ncbi:MAG: PA0069 family radical SAM protein [Woeseia sp.]|nr:PA0069 family radical SAM protein [Woeseia sp.]MBT8095627.1 PA0069 family radical SAM protein [Woeseia sp.]NNE61537.1 PA0069 family radical SAM protein [Woeseia sp.]NNL54133.1 PA0069 family radical SAM protein [Woeseia sp.]
MAGTAHKGRGAIGQTQNRFEQRPVELTAQETFDRGEIAPETVLRPMHARSIISHNDSPDIPFDHSINPYVGCEHGCVYCYARPAHSYLDLSPGLDFETQIFYKPNAVERLLATWEKPGYRCEPITIGANTDPYQPAERRLEITRQLLQVFLDHRHPVSLISKGTAMRRDLDLLAALAERNLCSVAISIPTMDSALKRQLEPRVPAASARLKLLQALSDAGVPCSVLVAPVIPAVNDSEIEKILEQAALHGARSAAWILLRLPHEVREIFSDWLDQHLPDRADHVKSLLRQAHGGREYDSRFGHRQSGSGPYASMIGQRFRASCKRVGLTTGERPQALDCSGFRPPGQQQLGLEFGGD